MQLDHKLLQCKYLAKIQIWCKNDVMSWSRDLQVTGARDPVTPQPRLPRHRYEPFFVPSHRRYNLIIIPTGPRLPIALKQESLWCRQIKPTRRVDQTSAETLVVYSPCLWSPPNPLLIAKEPSSVIWPIRCFA